MSNETLVWRTTLNGRTADYHPNIIYSKKSTITEHKGRCNIKEASLMARNILSDAKLG